MNLFYDAAGADKEILATMMGQVETQLKLLKVIGSQGERLDGLAQECKELRGIIERAGLSSAGATDAK